MASTYLTRTSTGTVSNAKKFTYSVWIKRSLISSGQHSLFSSYPSGTNNDVMYIPATDELGFWGTISGSQSVYYLTNRKLRDTNAWYHIVLAVDTTQATAGDRVKIYINGVQETSFSQSSAPSQNTEFRFAQASNLQEIGSQNTSSTFDGLMSHIHFIDGTQYAASDFGETDSTTGEWKIKTSPSVTYGTNGFFILKDGNSVTDQSGNSNNFTVAAGTLTNTEDCPSNNFTTWNKLNFGRYNNSPALPTFTYGNTRVKFTDGTYDQFCASTLPITAGGNYYWEVKLSASPNSGHIGIYDAPSYITGTPNNLTGTYIYRYNGTKVVNGASPTSFGSSYTNGDIIGLAFNGTSGTLWVSKNGVWQNSATQSEIEAGTTTNSLATGIDTTKDLFPYIQDYNNSQYDANFGNGYFAGTAITSEGTNASGIGKFEYDVPSGYTALSTKGLNE